MSEILPFLYLGDESASRSERFLSEKRITHVINVTGDRQFYDSTRYNHRIAVKDIPSQNIVKYIPEVTEVIDNARKMGGVVLIHCVNGISRSAALVIGYMMNTLKFKRAYAYVVDKRPGISPNNGFMAQLRAL